MLLIYLLQENIFRKENEENKEKDNKSKILDFWEKMELHCKEDVALVHAVAMCIFHMKLVFNYQYIFQCYRKVLSELNVNEFSCDNYIK